MDGKMTKEWKLKEEAIRAIMTAEMRTLESTPER
jgi:hypothetical protein